MKTKYMIVSSANNVGPANDFCYQRTSMWIVDGAPSLESAERSARNTAAMNPAMRYSVFKLVSDFHTEPVVVQSQKVARSEYNEE